MSRMRRVTSCAAALLAGGWWVVLARPVEGARHTPQASVQPGQAGPSRLTGPPLAHPDWPELSMPGPPLYPPDALAAKKGGWVPLELDTAADGHVIGVRELRVDAPGAVSSATAPSLVAAAVQAARQATIRSASGPQTGVRLYVVFNAREGSVTLQRTPPLPPDARASAAPGPGAPSVAPPPATREEFAKEIEALTRRSALDPNDAEPFCDLASRYWERAFRDSSLSEAEKRELVSTGLAYVDRALALRPDYADAMIRKGLLLRSKAMFETDEARKQDLIAEATRLRDEAVRLKKR